MSDLPEIDFDLKKIAQGGLELIEIKKGWLEGRPLLSVPHRHHFHEMVWITEGNDTHVVDIEEYRLTKNQLLFIPKNSIHHYIPDSSARGWKLIFDEHFFTAKQFQIIKGLLLLVPGLGKKNIQFEYDLLQIMRNMMSLLPRLKGISQQQILMLSILTFAEDIYKSKIEVSDDLFINFLRLLEKNISRKHDVGFYADKLNVTHRSLARSVRRSTGKTTSEYIHSRLLVESMCRLQHREWNVKDIAYSLGFSDPFYFSRFFKQRSGLSPEYFRLTRL